MLAYDVPLSALLYIVYAGVPEEYIKRPTEEEDRAHIEMIRKIVENKNDDL